MTKLNGYRLSTAVFALLFAVMVVREVTRTELRVGPRDPGRAPAEVPTPAVPATESGKASPSDAPPEDTPATEAPAPVPAMDLARKLVSHHMFRSEWEGFLPTLRERREELIPIFEDWLRRRKELSAAHIPLDFVPAAYADLAGLDALPLLVSILESRERPWTHVPAAFCRIDDPAAVDVVRRHQAAMPAREWFVRPLDLWDGAPAFRRLCIEWAVTPPDDRTWIAGEIRPVIFRRGTNEERERIWSLMGRRSRLKSCYGGLARLWGPPWPERFRELVTSGLDDADPWVRHYAADRIIRDREHVTADLVSRAERTLEQDLAGGKPEGDAPEPKYLKASLELLRKWKQEEVAERKKRDLLTPR